MSTVTLQATHKPHFWVLVPTYNPGFEAWAQWVHALQMQNCKPMQVVVLDSGSTDGSLALSQQAGFTVFHTQAQNFNHGGSRQWALDQALQALQASAQAPEWVVFLTQDALLAKENAFQELLSAFEDPQVAAAYGRQIAKQGASWVEVHARSFNYPKASKKVELKDKAKLGIKACFLSNSFAAYRLQALQQAGGFPSSLPLGEDTYTAAQLLKAGHRIAYQAAASVYHSHNYNGRQDFQRMFDTGVFHAQNQWLIQTFGSAEGEGIRLLKSQWAYLTQSHPTEQNEQNDQNDQSDQEHPNVQKPNFLIGMAQILAINFTKLVGYKIGRAYTCLPKSLVIKFAMHKPFWQPKP